jgi:hypothetical protein
MSCLAEFCEKILSMILANMQQDGQKIFLHCVVINTNTIDEANREGAWF